MARVRKGDRVLIECATGGVGVLAIQMARHVGAEVIASGRIPADVVAEALDALEAAEA